MSNPYENSITLVRSKKARDILEHLKKREDYPSSMAQHLESEQSSISATLTGLLEYDLIIKTKRSKAQFYEITKKGEKFLKSKKELDKGIKQLKQELASKLDEGDLEDFYFYEEIDQK